MAKLKLALVLVLSGAAAFAAFASFAAGCSGDSNSEASDTRPKAKKSRHRFPHSAGSIVIRKRTDVARTTPRKLRGRFGEVSIEVVVRARRPSRRAWVSVACLGPGQGQANEFLVVPRSGAYVIRQRDAEPGVPSPFDLLSRSSNALRPQAFKLQVLCRAEGSATLVLGVDGRIITETPGTLGMYASPWNKVAVTVRPRSGIVLEDLVVRAKPGEAGYWDFGDDENALP